MSECPFSRVASALCINPFSQDQMLDQTKLKAFAGDRLNVTKMINSVFDRAENIVQKGEIACISNFSFSHNVSKRLLSQILKKVSLSGKGFTDTVYEVQITLSLSLSLSLSQ